MFLLFFKRGHLINLNQTAVMTHQVQLAIFILATLVSPHYSIYRKRVKLATSNSENGNDQYCMNVFDCRVWEFIRKTIELGTSQCLKYNCASENWSVLNNEWFRPQVLGHMVIVFKCIFLAGERLKNSLLVMAKLVLLLCMVYAISFVQGWLKLGETGRWMS